MDWSGLHALMSKIEFKLVDDVIADIISDCLPTPAAKAIPKWYKEIPSFVESDNTTGLQTVKRCVPFLDVFTQGYILYQHADLALFAGDDGELMKLDGQEHKWVNSIETHISEQFPYCPYHDKYPYSKHTMKFLSPWYIHTPPGWSCLFTSPLNHFEPRFKIIDGVVDTDTWKGAIHFPFVWTGLEKGEQIIKRKTPMCQVIPFKREELEMEISTLTNEEIREKEVHDGRWNFTVRDYYRNEAWHKRKK